MPNVSIMGMGALKQAAKDMGDRGYQKALIVTGQFLMTVRLVSFSCFLHFLTSFPK